MDLFNKLIGGIGCDEFFVKYWTKEEYHSKSHIKNNDLFSLSDFENVLVLNRDHLTFPVVRLVKNGKILPETKFTYVDKKSQHNTARKISLEKIKFLCENGATVIFNGLNNYSQRLSDFCLQLSSEFGEPVQVNAYLSQKGTQGFAAHYDHHEIFIFQILGEKTWSIYGKADSYPLPASLYYDQGEPNRKDQRIFNLTPGDMLYVPRGLWHEAESINSSSFHLTINVKCTLKIDFLKWAIDRLAQNDSNLRRNLHGKLNVYNSNDYDFIKKYLINYVIEPSLVNEFKENINNDITIDLPFTK